MISIFLRLSNIISKFHTEKSNLNSYDNLIKNVLGVNEIPKSKGTYYVDNVTKSLQVDSRDLDIFHKLIYITPPKKNKTKGLNRSIGNGEVALYWLFKYQINNNEVSNSNNPFNYDLIISI